MPPGPPASRSEVLDRLDPVRVDAVTSLVDAATAADGVPPLSEHVLLHLRYGGESPARSLLLWHPDGRLAAYAHLDVTDAVEGPSAELVVAPGLRGRGYGRTLVELLSTQASDPRLRLWAHGQLAPAAALATSLGFVQVRALWQLRRSLDDPIPQVPLPPGVVVRAFRPGRDEAAWVRLNARAFARHPEQGSWTVADLRLRMSEPWFDPHGFFLAERDGQLVGFHWTKVHGGDTGSEGSQAGQGGHGHAPIGEVYVLGVDPAAQGAGLGRALCVVGLRHLRTLGLPAVMLYVDADNPAAIGVYTALGFRHWTTDVMFRRSGPTETVAADRAAGAVGLRKITRAAETALP